MPLSGGEYAGTEAPCCLDGASLLESCLPLSLAFIDLRESVVGTDSIWSVVTTRMACSRSLADASGFWLDFCEPFVSVAEVRETDAHAVHDR